MVGVGIVGTMTTAHAICSAMAALGDIFLASRVGAAYPLAGTGYELYAILSYRDVEDLLAERGLDLSYETVRRWVLKFGPAISHRLHRQRSRPSNRGHLDEMVVRISGKRMYLWRAVDHEGEVLDALVQRRRDTRAAMKLMRKLLRKQGFAPRLVVTDKMRSYAAAFQIGRAHV